jgi:CHAT domain-containing protein/tetratricopeptide (TPR) repeat protein
MRSTVRPQPSPFLRRASLNARRTAFRLVLLGVLCGLAGTDSTAPGLLGAFTRMQLPRVVAPRLSIAGEYRPCVVPLPIHGHVPQAECPPLAASLRSSLLSQYSTAVAQAARAPTDPRVLHALGITELVLSDREGNSIDRSIQHLQNAAQLSGRPAPILGDLAAAYLARAGLTQQPRDLLQAIEVADSAVSLDPASIPARTTLAYTLEALTLQTQAAAAWRTVAAARGSPEWRDEARSRLAKLESPPPAPEPSPGASDMQLTAFARIDAQAAERAAWTALGTWGEAVLGGEASRAAESLRRAEVLGRALQERSGDAGIADAVGAVRAQGGMHLRALARAHHAYAQAGRAAKDLDFHRVERLLRPTEGDATASAVLRAWMRVSLGVAQVYNGDNDAGVQVFRAMLAEVDSARYPSLAARVRWTLANTLQRPGAYEAALPLLAGAERLYTRAGHTENRAVMQFLEGTARVGLGDPSGAYRPVYAALTTLRDNPRSAWLHTVLVDLARTAAEDGLIRAALRIAAEDVAVADRTGEVKFQAEARLRRAELRLAHGDTARVGQDLEWARAAVAQMDSSEYAHGVLDASLRLVDARRRLAVEPARASGELDLVVERTAGVHARLLPALFARAEARLAAGQGPGAEQDLHRAMEILDAQRNGIGSADLRASVMDAGRRVVDRAMMLALAQGRFRHALEDLELARTSFAPVVSRGSPARLAGPPGEVVLEYALVGDTLLAWTLADTMAVLTRQVVNAGWLERTVREARMALELGRGAAVPPALEALYDVLIRPLQARLGGEGMPLVVIADGALAGVPFPALRDRTRGRFLVEDHGTRFASSLRDAVRLPPGRVPAGGVLMVNPAFDPAEFPGLERLPAAAGEVREVARGYTGARLLAGSEAAREPFQAALLRVGVVHYAGHAVFDEGRPERSYLVLASGGGPPRLRAAEVAEMDLRGLRLVVLSACETLRGEGRRSGGFQGLAGAFLAAGAGGVAGSLWRVDDRRTRVLMVAFHREYRVSGNGAQALRAAQIQMLRSPDAELRSPSAWAGFRYAGG